MAEVFGVAQLGKAVAVAGGSGGAGMSWKHAGQCSSGHTHGGGGCLWKVVTYNGGELERTGVFLEILLYERFRIG